MTSSTQGSHWWCAVCARSLWFDDDIFCRFRHNNCMSCCNIMYCITFCQLKLLQSFQLLRFSFPCCMWYDGFCGKLLLTFRGTLCPLQSLCGFAICSVNLFPSQQSDLNLQGDKLHLFIPRKEQHWIAISSHNCNFFIYTCGLISNFCPVRDKIENMVVVPGGLNFMNKNNSKNILLICLRR